MNNEVSSVEVEKDFDFSEIDTVAACNKGFELQLVHPSTKAPLKVWLKIVGKDSDAFNAKVAEQRNADIRLASEAAKRGKQPKLKTHEESKREEAELLASCVIGFRCAGGSYVMLKGQKLLYSEANVIKLLTEMPSIKEQVDGAVVNLENFLKG